MIYLAMEWLQPQAGRIALELSNERRLHRKNGAARLKLKFSVTKLESSFWSEISLRVEIIFERGAFSYNCLL